MIRVGIVGIGFMGWIHYLAYQRVRGVKLAAICTRDEKKRQGDWRGIKGNFGPPGEKVDVSGLAAYEHLDQLLADPQIDLVDLCLPPHLHREAAIRALQAGKHVLCEKPLALTAAECQKMVQAAEKSGRQLLVAHVLPFFPEFTFALEAAQSGKYGRLLGGHFKRVISDPLWLKDFYDPERVGGPLVDLHVHDAHFLRVLFGMPQSLVSQGRMQGEVVKYCNTMFSFADPSLVVTATSGVIDQQARPFTHGFEMHFEKATLQYEMAVVGDKAELLMPLTIYDHRGKATPAKLKTADEITPFVNEIKEAARAIESGQPSALLSGELARDAITLCHKQTQSVRSGRAVRV